MTGTRDGALARAARHYDSGAFMDDLGRRVARARVGRHVVAHLLRVGLDLLDEVGELGHGRDPSVLRRSVVAELFRQVAPTRT